MNNSLKQGFWLPFMAFFSFFIYWIVSHYLFRDLVWDELVSLKNFTLVDFKTSVTYYPDVNNHVFFNFLTNGFCRIIGITSIYEAMDNIPLVRIFPLIISLITLLYTFKATSKVFGQTAGLYSLIILMTCIPFLNFTMQLRGYTLSMALMAMSIYYLLSFEEKPSFLKAGAGVFSLFGLLYAIPSNIYFVLSLGIAYALKWYFISRKKEVSEVGSTIKNWFVNKRFYILLIIGFGTMLSFVAYLPILDDLLNERHLQQLKGQSFYEYNLKEIIPFVLYYILSYRFLLVIPFIVIVFKLVSHAKKREWTREDDMLLMMISLVLLSFLISLIRGDKPHQRTFTPLTVVFSILFGGSVYTYFQDFKWLSARNQLSFFIVFFYCISSFFFCDNLIQKTLHKSIISGNKVYNMFYNFYQSKDYGMRNLDLLIEQANVTKYPIIMTKEIDRVAEGEYLLKHNLEYYSTVYAKAARAENKAGYEYQVLFEISQGQGQAAIYNKIAYPPSIDQDAAMFIPLFSFLYQSKKLDQENPVCYVLTFAPRWFEGIMKKSLPNMTYQKLNPESNYHNIYLISMKEFSSQ